MLWYCLGSAGRLGALGTCQCDPKYRLVAGGIVVSILFSIIPI